MRTDSPQTIYRKDYTPPSYLVDTVELGFDLDPAQTVVANRVKLRHNPDSKSRELVLHGEDIELVAIRMNGVALKADQYILGNNTLTIRKAPTEVLLEIETICAPEQNTTHTNARSKSG